MAGAARLLVEIAASLGTFREDLGKAGAIAETNAKRIERAFERTQDRLKDFGKDLGRSVIGALGISLGAEGIVRAFEAITEKAIDEERSLNLLTAALTATGHAAGLTAAQLAEIGKGVEDRSIFDDDQIRKASVALLRFRSVQGDTFREALRLAPDVATALGTDLPTAAVTLGKALSDPERGMRALRDAGVYLSDQQKDLAARLLESGDAAGAAKVVLEELATRIGGVSEADNTGAYGATKRLSRAWGDLLKSMGRPVVTNTEAVNGLTEFLGRLQRKIEETDYSLKKFYENPFTSAINAGKKLAEVFGLRDESFAFPVPQSADEAAAKRAEERAATVGKLIADQQREREKEYNDEQADLKRRAGAAAAFYGAQLQEQKAFLDQRRIQEEFAYSRGALTIQEFYDKQRTSAEQAAFATAHSIDEQIAASQRLANAPSTSKEGRLAEELKIQTLRKQESVEVVALNTRMIQIDQQQTLAVEKLGDAYGELAERIAIAQGDSAKAAQIAFERSNRQFRRELEHIRDTGNPQASQEAADTLARMRGIGLLEEAQAKLNDKEREYRTILDALGVAQSRLDTEAQTGTLSEIALLNKRADVARSFIPILTEQYEAQKRITELAISKGELFGPAKDSALGNLARMRQEIDQLGVAADGLKNKFDGVFTDGITGFLDDATDRTKTWAQAFENAGQRIERTITHLISEDLAKQLYKSIFGEGGITGGTTPGGFLASIFSSIFGSGPHSLGGAYASGTSFASGGWSLVGERGPELVNLPRGSQVLSHEQSMRGGLTVVQNITNVPGVDRRSRAQQASEAWRRASQAVRVR